MVVAVSPSTQRTVLKRLYRSLLRASRPFTPPSPNAVVLTCLLDRTGTEDASWVDFLRGNRDKQQHPQQHNMSASSSASADNETSSMAEAAAAAVDNEEESGTESSEDDDDDEYDFEQLQEDDDDDDDVYNNDHDPCHVMFRKLLREAINSTDEPKGIRQMQFPSHVVAGDPYRIRNIIRREFRRHDDDDDDNDNDNDDDKLKLLAVKKQVAFLALRKLNEKLAWAQHLLEQQTTAATTPAAVPPLAQQHHEPHQAPAAEARRQRLGGGGVVVSPLPLRPPESYLRPGAFLIAHPNLNGYFRRTVICILAHREEDEGGGIKINKMHNNNNYDDDQVVSDPAFVAARRMVGTYGLVVNRTCVAAHSGKPFSLQETIRPLPEQLSKAFGESLVRDGGPVQVSLQMLHCLTPDLLEELQIGGHVLPMIPSSSETDDDDDDAFLESTARFHSDRVVLFQGDILKATTAVTSGRLNPKDDVTFFVGASSWMPGQLESEIERGIWLPCRAPPEIAMYGTSSSCCEKYMNQISAIRNRNVSSSTASGMEAKEHEKKRIKPDLWLSLLSACGEEEAKLAHLLWNDDGLHRYGSTVDSF